MKFFLIILLVLKSSNSLASHPDLPEISLNDLGETNKLGCLFTFARSIGAAIDDDSNRMILYGIEKALAGTAKMRRLSKAQEARLNSATRELFVF